MQLVEMALLTSCELVLLSYRKVSESCHTVPASHRDLPDLLNLSSADTASDGLTGRCSSLETGRLAQTVCSRGQGR